MKNRDIYIRTKSGNVKIETREGIEHDMKSDLFLKSLYKVGSSLWDLIVPGDIVNGNRVHKCELIGNRRVIKFISGVCIDYEDLESFLTRESYELNCFRRKRLELRKRVKKNA